jgi:hypothetical protein
MIRTGPLMVVVIASAWLCAQSSPRGAEPENEDSRFSFYRADGGFLRLDGRSGQVSLCTKHEAGWLCEALPEERAAFEAEIARLQGDNAALKQVVLAHDLPLPGGMAYAPPAAAPGAADHQANRLVSAIEVVWRRLVAMVTSVQRDLLKRS